MKKFLIVLGVFIGAVMLIYIAAPRWIIFTMLDYAKFSGGFKSEQVVVDEYTCHYLDNHRKDKPVVVLLHGFADRKESWLPFINKFASDYRLIIPDAMGHGENFRDTSKTYSLVNQAAFINQLTTELDVGKFHLVGISMGGGIAAHYTAANPEDVLSLMLISSAGMDACRKPSALDMLMEKYPTAEEKTEHFPLIPKTYSRANARMFKKYIFYGNFFVPNRLFREYLREVIDEREFFLNVLGDFINIGNGQYRNPVKEEITTITCPVLIIWGKQDPLIDASCAYAFKDNFPKPPELVMIDECGHATIVEQPKQTFTAMQDFLTEVTSGGS